MWSCLVIQKNRSRWNTACPTGKYRNLHAYENHEQYYFVCLQTSHSREIADDILYNIASILEWYLQQGTSGNSHRMQLSSSMFPTHARALIIITHNRAHTPSQAITQRASPCIKSNPSLPSPSPSPFTSSVSRKFAIKYYFHYTSNKTHTQTPTIACIYIQLNCEQLFTERCKRTITKAIVCLVTCTLSHKVQ